MAQFHEQVQAQPEAQAQAQEQPPPAATTHELIANCMHVSLVKGPSTVAYRQRIKAYLQTRAIVDDTFEEYHAAVIILAGCKESGVEGLTGNFNDSRLTLTFEYLAKDYAFPNDDIDWKRIAWIISLALSFVTDAASSQMPLVRYGLIFDLLFDFITAQFHQTQITLVAFVQANGGWLSLIQEAAAHQVRNVPLPVVADAGSTNTCWCGIFRTLERDIHLPAQRCNNCAAYWCQIGECKLSFAGPIELTKHQRMCHKHPSGRQRYCSCRQVQPSRTSFVLEWRNCCNPNCDRYLCEINGCPSTNKEYYNNRTHQLTHHLDPFLCGRCGSEKLRGYENDPGLNLQVCIECGKFWCPFGHCPKEFDDEARLNAHKLKCEFIDPIE